MSLDVEKSLLTIPGNDVNLAFQALISRHYNFYGDVLIGRCPIQAGKVGLTCSFATDEQLFCDRCTFSEVTFKGIVEAFQEQLASKRLARIEVLRNVDDLVKRRGKIDTEGIRSMVLRTPGYGSLLILQMGGDLRGKYALLSDRFNFSPIRLSDIVKTQS